MIKCSVDSLVTSAGFDGQKIPLPCLQSSKVGVLISPCRHVYVITKMHVHFLQFLLSHSCCHFYSTHGSYMYIRKENENLEPNLLAGYFNA